MGGADFDREVKAARKRGVQPRVAVARDDGDPSDPLHGENESYDERVRAARAKRARGEAGE